MRPSFRVLKLFEILKKQKQKQKQKEEEKKEEEEEIPYRNIPEQYTSAD